MKLRVLYDKQGKILGGGVVGDSVGFRIVAPAGHFVRDFDVPAEHAQLAPKDLWRRLRVDVQFAEHRLIVSS